MRSLTLASPSSPNAAIEQKVVSHAARLALVSALVTSPLLGQQVAGVARVADSKAAAPGSAIVLVNSAGVIVAGTLTQADGRYVLRAPSTGRFRVRARRIGFSPDSSGDLRLDSGTEAHFDPVLKPLTTSLNVVTVEGSQRCETTPQSGALASQLWEAAQNALAATIASAGGGQIAFRLARFQREVEPGTGRIIRGSTQEMRALNSEPYRSVAPDSLAKTGFARSEGDSSIYFAPDARTLTSEIFIETHCIRAVTDAANPTQIGLAFEPTGHPHLVDVAGVLWLDRASGQLRDLDYHYQFPRAVRTSAGLQSTEPATGHIEYKRLENGVWIVDRWIIRVPVLSDERVTTMSPAGAGANITLRSARGNRTTAIWEIGGNVSAVLRPSDPSFLQTADLGEVHGTLVMGPGRVVISGVTVALAPLATPSTSRTTQSSASGAFTFDSIPEGDYVLNVTSPSFDSLNVVVPPVPVRVSSGSEQTLTITVPSPEEGRAALCPSAKAGFAVVHGTVTDSASGAPIAGARVHAYWLTGAVRTGGNGGGLAASANESVTFSDASGKYAFCEIEPTTRLLLSASVGTRKTQRHPSLTIGAGGIRLADLQIPK
jgi:hypothetical protein